MRIVIDFQGAQNDSRYRGIGRYASAFTKHFLKLARHHEVFLVLNGAFKESISEIRSEFNSLISQSRIMVWLPISPTRFYDAENDSRRLASQAIREAFLASLSPDVVLLTSLVDGAGDDVVTSIGTFASELKTAVIHYDLIPLYYEQEYLFDENIRAWYFDKLDHLSRANLLLAISESSRNEAIEQLGVSPDSIVNISSAVDESFAQRKGTPIASLARRLGIDRPFLIYVGAQDARKNLGRLVEAFSALPLELRRNHQLVLAGKLEKGNVRSLQARAKSRGLSDTDVVFTGYVNDEDVVGLYRAAVGLVFASYHEGFGLPVLEAMTLGTPVIAAESSSIPEVLGNKEAMFDPFSTESVANAIQKLLVDREFRSRLVAHAHEQRLRFSWERTASRALKAIEHRFDQQSGQRNSANGESMLSLEQTEYLAHHVTGLLKNSPASNDLRAAAIALDLALPRERTTSRLYVDVSELHERDAGTGIQRVVKSIASQILHARLPANHEIKLVYAKPGQGYWITDRLLATLSQDRCNEADTVVADSPIDVQNGDVFLGLDYQERAIVNNEPFFDWLRAIGVQTYFVVYDLLPQTRTGLFIPEVSVAHTQWLRSVARADGLICISRTVAEELLEWLDISSDMRRVRPLKVGWFQLGADFTSQTHAKNHGPLEGTLFGAMRDRKTFLAVGTLEPRKRQEQILNAFELLWDEDEEINLVIVGKQGWLVENLAKRLSKHRELNHRLFWIRNASDAKLDLLYREATCLIAASLGEGFGLPLVEAMSRGLPVIARDIPVFREVAGTGATYFQGSSPRVLAATIQEWLHKPAADKRDLKNTMHWIKWSESATQLASLILDNNWQREWPEKLSKSVP